MIFLSKTVFGLQILAFVASHTYEETSTEFGISEIPIVRIKKLQTQKQDHRSKESVKVSDTDIGILKKLILPFTQNRIKVDLEAGESARISKLDF